jgi:hypothetical protein
MSRLPEIQILEKGYLYKVRQYVRDGYTIFSPKVTRKVINFDRYRYIPFIFAVYGRGKNAHINIAKGIIDEVRVIDGNYVKRLNAKDYLKLSKLLKDKGYRFDKKTRKLINLNP